MIVGEDKAYADKECTRRLQKMFPFYSAQVVALDIHHAASKSNEKMTNSNGNIAELMIKLNRAAPDCKTSMWSGLYRYLPSYGTKDLTGSLWRQQPVKSCSASPLLLTV